MERVVIGKPLLLLYMNGFMNKEDEPVPADYFTFDGVVKSRYLCREAAGKRYYSRDVYKHASALVSPA